jgi:hypothetical protein
LKFSSFFGAQTAYDMPLVRIGEDADLDIQAAGSRPIAPVSIPRALSCLPSTQLCGSFLGLETAKCRKSEQH